MFLLLSKCKDTEQIPFNFTFSIFAIFLLLTDTVILLNLESESCIKFGFILYRNALQENDHGLMSMKAVFHSFISDQFKMNRYNKRCIIIKEREKMYLYAALCTMLKYTIYNKEEDIAYTFIISYALCLYTNTLPLINVFC